MSAGPNAARSRAPRSGPVLWGVALSVAAVFWALAGPASAQVRDRRLRWRTIETEHFAVHYPQPLGMLARRVADVAERAHARLVTVFDHAPRERVEMVLTDDTDSANGSATPLPFANIRLFASAPSDLTPLGDYDDWFTVLVTHEDTHIVHLDTIGGIPALINAVLGKSYAPNLIQPRWFIEGLATHVESAETSGGRIRSTMFEMYMRMATLEDRLLTLDQLSSSVDAWPRGTAWYLYGGRFVDFIARRYGRDALTQISHAYGRQLVPYGVNRVAQRVTGKTFVELYAEWQDDLREKHGRVRDEVVATGRVEGERITFHGELARSPRFVDEETLVYYVADGHNDPALRLIDRSGHDPRQLTRVVGEAYAAPAGRGRMIYDSLDAHRDIYFMNDLFMIDGGERTRLTEGLRAQHPDLAPDGRRLVFTSNSAGTTHLMMADLQDVQASARVLLRSRRYEQVFTPRWSPDGTTIAISRWRAPGYRDVVLVDAQSGDVRAVTDDRALDTGPAWSPDGRTLYFSSDRTGIANLFAYDLETGATHQVTNSLSGAYAPTVNPNGRELVYLGYTSFGFDLFRLPLDRSTWRDAPLYENNRPAAVEPGESALLSSRYRPARTVYPRSYLLDFQPDSFGTQLGVTIAGTDLAEHHRYAARVGVSLAEGYVNADASWVFQRTPAPVTLHAFRRVALRGGLQVAGEERNWVEDAIGADVGLNYSIPRMLHAESISANYSVVNLRQGEPFGGTLDPNTPPPVLPTTGRLASLRVGWGYSNVRQHFYDMFPSEGRNFGASISLSHPVLGSAFRAASLSWSWTRHVEAPWRQHHVFSLRYGGGISGGDLGHRGVFALGGFGDASLFDQLRNQSSLGGTALRGYDPFSRAGTQFQLVQLEYRFPLFRIMRGIQTLPVYLNRTYALVFVDVGDAYRGRFDPTTLRVGAGAEIFLDFTLGFILPFTMRIGFAYGFMDEEAGGAQFYAHLGVPF